MLFEPNVRFHIFSSVRVTGMFTACFHGIST